MTSNSFSQNASGAMTYPAKGTLNWLLFKLPKFWWRVGLGPIQGRWQLVLTTYGRKSKLPRHTMLSYTVYQGKAYIISGWNERSDWYKNLDVNPVVTVQSALGSYTACARRVSNLDEYRRVMVEMFRSGGDSHFKPWLKSLEIAYNLEDALAKRDRVFLIALDPVLLAGPPGMPADLVWVWGVIGAALIFGWRIGRRSRR